MTDQPTHSTGESDTTTEPPEPGSSTALFSLEGVTKRYGPVLALEGISLEIYPGTFHVLAGPNGAGKSTLLSVLAGLERPTSGTVDRTTDDVGCGFQQPRFYPDLTPRENLEVFRQFAKEPPPVAWIETLLSELRLEAGAHRRGRELSGGFQSKLDLALSLVGQPQVVLLDEPLSDIDAHSANAIVDVLDSYRRDRDDRTVVVSTHAIETFAPVVDRLTVVVDGEIRFDGTPEGDVLGQYRSLVDSASK